MQEPEQPHLLHPVIMYQAGIFSEKILKTSDAFLPTITRKQFKLPSLCIVRSWALLSPPHAKHSHAHHAGCFSVVQILKAVPDFGFLYLLPRNPLPLDLLVVSSLQFNSQS